MSQWIAVLNLMIPEFVAKMIMTVGIAVLRRNLAMKDKAIVIRIAIVYKD